MLVLAVDCSRLLIAHALGISRWVLLNNLPLACLVKSGPTTPTTSPALNTASSHAYLDAIPADIAVPSFGFFSHYHTTYLHLRLDNSIPKTFRITYSSGIAIERYAIACSPKLHRYLLAVTQCQDEH